MSDEEHVREADDAEEGGVQTGVSVDFENQEYRNWVKGAKGLEYLQQGLAPFVDRQIVLQHSIFKNKLPAYNTTCGCNFQNILPDHDKSSCQFNRCLCKNKSRRKCPNNGYCSTMCQLILSEHKHDDPLWKNTNITDWPSDHWSIAKCFMTTKCPSKSAQTTDAAGLLSVIINAKFFDQFVTRPVGQQALDTFSKAREKRNEILHKARLQLTDTELQSSIDTFIAVLTDQTTLFQDQDAARAVVNLEKLKTGQINISMAEEEEILHRRQHAISTLKHMEEERGKLEGERAAVGEAFQQLSEHEQMLVAAHKKRLDELNELLTNTEKAIEALEQREAIAKEKQAESMEKDRKDLRRNLAELFKTHHIKTSVCPLKTNENDFVIHDVYVTPNLTKETKKGSPDGSIEVEHVSLNDINEIFESKGNPPLAIYILGEVGSGKSAICKELMYKWCQSVDGRADTPGKITEFEFLFYLPLRNFHGNDNVRQMIHSGYGYMVSKEVLDDVLRRTPDKCFILMDGLDEWSPPTSKVAGHVTYGLPDSRDVHNATIVTTSRSSAPGVLKIMSSEYDQKIYLNGIKKKYVKELVDKYICKMGRQCDNLVSKNTILKTLGSLQLGDLEKTPMLLQQIIWLLNEGYEVGNSVSAVYSSMLNIALRWLEEKSSQDDTRKKCHDLKPGVLILDFPKMVEEFSSVESLRYHICVMSEIAFDITTNKCNSKTMIGRKYLRQRGISEDVIRDILDIGLLKKEECNDPTQQSNHYTFVHQSFLEYFAALYVTSSQHQVSEDSSVNHVTTLFRSCKTVQDMLQLENVIVLISGLSPHLICDVFAHTYHIAQHDTQYSSEREEILKEGLPGLKSKQCAVQTLLVRCLSEGHCDTVSGRQKLALLDLMLLQTVNQDITKEQTLLLNYVNPKQVLKLHLLMPFRVPYAERENASFSKLISSVLQNIDQFQILQTIEIREVFLSHNALAKLSTYISKTASQTDICLRAIKCVDHDDCKHEINLSHHTKLKILNIADIKVFHISNINIRNINTTLIECCITDQEDIVTSMTGAEKLKEIDFSCVHHIQAIGNIIKQNLLLTNIRMTQITTVEECEESHHAVIDLSGHSQLTHLFVRDVPALQVIKLNTSNLEKCYTDKTELISLLSYSPKLKHLICCVCSGTRPLININICQVLNTLSQLHTLWIRNADIEDNALKMTPDMISLGTIMLNEVRMSLPSWRTFVDSLLTLKQTVRVKKSPADQEEMNYVRNNGAKFQFDSDTIFLSFSSCVTSGLRK